jgi:hypothetical protein
MRLITNEELLAVSGGAIKIGSRPVYTPMGDFAGYEDYEYDDGEDEPDQVIEIKTSKMTPAQKVAYDMRELCDALAKEGLGNFTVSGGISSNTIGGEAGGKGSIGSVEINGKATVSRTSPGATASGPCRP